MKSFRKYIIAIAILVIAAACFLSVNELNPENFLDISQDIREVKKSNIFTYTLTPQDYFLKIKIFLRTDQSTDSSVYFNNKKLKCTKRKLKSGYEKLYFIIDRIFVNDGQNSLRLDINDVFVESIFLNLSDYYKKLWGGVVICPLSKKISKTAHLHTILMLIVPISFLWYLLFVSLKRIFRFKNYYVASLLSLAPFLFINLSIIFARIAKYQILISPFLYMFIFLVTVFFVFFLLLMRQALKLMFVFFSSNFDFKKLVFGFGSIVIVFIVFLLLDEGVARIYINYFHPVKIFKQSDKYLSYELNPNVQLEFAGEKVKINSEGFRGDFSFAEKNKEHLRIAFIGDSIVFGYGVKDSKTIPQQLENYLNKFRKVEVLNFAITGYNTYQEKLFFEKKGLQYSPAILIYGFCLNDIGGNMFVPTGFNTLLSIGDFNYRYADFNCVEKMQYYLLRNSYFYQFILYKWKILKEHLLKRERGYSDQSLRLMKGELDSKTQQEIEKFKHEVLEIKNICDNNHITFVVIAFGNDLQISSSTLRWPQQWLSGFCNENNILYLDLLPPIQGYSKDEVFIDEGHPTEFGNAVLSGYVGDYLKRSGLLN